MQQEDGHQEAEHDAHRQRHAELAYHGHLGYKEGDKADYRRQQGDAHRGEHARQRVNNGLADRLAVEQLLMVAILELDGIVDAQADEDGKHRHGSHGYRHRGIAHYTEGPKGANAYHEKGEQPPAHPEHDHQHQNHHQYRQDEQHHNAASQAGADGVDQLAGGKDGNLYPIQGMGREIIFDYQGNVQVLLIGHVPFRGDRNQDVAFIGDKGLHRRADRPAIVIEHVSDEGGVIQRGLADELQLFNLGLELLQDGRLRLLGGLFLLGFTQPHGRRRRPGLSRGLFLG